MITYRFELKAPFNSKHLSIVGTSSENMQAYVKLHSPPSPTTYDEASQLSTQFTFLIENPLLDNLYYLMLTCDKECHYEFKISEASDTDIENGMPSPNYHMEKFHQFLFKYHLTEPHSLLTAKVEAKEGCLLEMFITDSGMPNVANSLKVNKKNQAQSVQIVNPNPNATYNIAVVALSEKCNYTIQVVGNMSAGEAIPLRPGVPRSDTNTEQFKFFSIEHQEHSKLFVALTSNEPIEIFLKEGSLPSDTDYDKKGTARNEYSDTFTSEHISSGKIYIGIKSKYNGIDYTLLALSYPDTLNFLNPGYETPAMIQKGELETYIVPYTSDPSDLILYLSELDGTVDIFIKQCSTNFSTCAFTTESTQNSLQNFEEMMTAKRVNKDHYMHIPTWFSYCSDDRCWISISVRARVLTNLRMLLQVNENQGLDAADPVEISRNDRLIFRYEVESYLNKSLLISLDCEYTNCDTFTGGIRVSRLNPDMSDFEKQYASIDNLEQHKYPLLYQSHHSVLKGLYYIEVSYNPLESQADTANLRLLVEEDMQEANFGYLSAHQQTYGSITADPGYVLYSINILGSEKLNEPIVLTLTPLNALFSVCLSPGTISKGDGSSKPASYTWCTSNLNEHEEYSIKIEATDPMYKSRGDYQILVKLKDVVDKSQEGFFIIQYASGDNRIALNPDEALTGKLDQDEPRDMYKVVLDYHTDVYFTINEMTMKVEKTLGWNVYIKDEEFEMRTLYSWTEDNWRRTYKNSISFFIPWENIVQSNSQKPKFYILYIDLYTREEEEEKTQYSITMSTENNIPQHLEQETAESYMLKPSQLDFFYIEPEEDDHAMVNAKYGKIEIFLRYMSTAEEGTDKQKWIRPVIPQYTTETHPEMPDDEPFIIRIDKQVVTHFAPTCYLLIGLLCSEDEIECVYDIINTKNETNPPVPTNVPTYQEEKQTEFASTETSNIQEQTNTANIAPEISNPAPLTTDKVEPVEASDWLSDHTMIMIVVSVCGIVTMVLIAWCCCKKKNGLDGYSSGDMDDSMERQPRYNAEGL